MSDSDRELDEVNFSDQDFTCLIQNNRGTSSGAAAGKRSSEANTINNMQTAHKFYRENGSNTRG